MQPRYLSWYGGEHRPPIQFVDDVERLVADPSTTRVCELGAGANPLLSLPAAAGAGVSEYVVTDISAEELEKAPAGYTKVVADATAAGSSELRGFDLVLSHTVAEHVRDPAEFHRAVLAMLRPGGRALHFFPTLYEPVFLLNRLLPESLTYEVLHRIQPGREHGGEHQKFPAYYRWCRGPTARQLTRLRAVGFEIEDYVGVFGHGYFHRLPVFDRMLTRLYERLATHPHPAFTAYAWMTLRRPPED